MLFMDHYYFSGWKSKLFNVFIQLISARAPKAEYGLL